MCKVIGAELYVLLVHPGGPVWANKDLGSWTIPKGLMEKDESEYVKTAIREFEEETGLVLPNCPLIPLGCTETNSRIIHAWAFHGDCNVDEIQSNTFHMEWPSGSGIEQEFEEIDRGKFFSIKEARKYISPGQVPLLNIPLDVLLHPIQICQKRI